MGISERIKQKRIELGLTQLELAQRMGYKSKAAICKVERGEDNITADRVSKFAKALNTTPAYLMGWTDEPITIEERPSEAMATLVDAYSFNEILKPYIKMLDEMPIEYRTKALTYIKEVYKEYLFDKAMKGE